MSNCIFWSSQKETVSCYAECPILGLKGNEDECVFKTFINNSNVHFKGVKLMDKIDEEELEDTFIKRFKVNSSY
ncbi:hypothetical protein SAMN02745163_00882 [Clostridium cavendishii DSM 21758]|uniref:Uncharacterized protein n=1 Tax=Clostridium cavendishii DSM 21758 TaxID=1121302 RepID=A0A1M6ELF0_9CLOT|nr:hypothetical protein [Clostridium cavendishii]SHI86317.1 hypothetical protein SAMN02745163_00882 [Clostridium cavendishii DSM 21758]